MNFELPYCTLEELLERRESKEICIFEATIDSSHLPSYRWVLDRNRVVTKYFRIGTNSRPLRNICQLKSTILYLFQDIWMNNNFDICQKYGFVFDRVQAVRQEVILQWRKDVSLFSEFLTINIWILRLLMTIILDIMIVRPISTAFFDFSLHCKSLSSTLAGLMTMIQSQEHIDCNKSLVSDAYRVEVGVVYLMLSMIDKISSVFDFNASNLYPSSGSISNISLFHHFVRYSCREKIDKILLTYLFPLKDLTKQHLLHVYGQWTQGNPTGILRSLVDLAKDFQSEEDYQVHCLHHLIILIFLTLPDLRYWRFLWMDRSSHSSGSHVSWDVLLPHLYYPWFPNKEERVSCMEGVKESFLRFCMQLAIIHDKEAQTVQMKTKDCGDHKLVEKSIVAFHQNRLSYVDFDLYQKYENEPSEDDLGYELSLLGHWITHFDRWNTLF